MSSNFPDDYSRRTSEHHSPEPFQGEYRDPDELSDGMKILLYIVTFIAPMIGVVAGIILSTNQTEYNRQVGKDIMTFGLIWLALGCICYFIFALA